ncbi:hypothetical protein GGI15_000023 [Coemansia interrupta]|uniref:Uncharacterized protein n=1 Tax=Coemansia interrupta TaxID=1126814 RepID=A0A9W8HRQ7_9FUNG|nr:hypothetical protein GGI15_000023 [Coemansia interrupta]
MGNQISGDNILSGRGVLLQDLFGGRTDLLATLIRQTHGVLSNHGNYLERDYANFVACALMVATLTGLLTHPSQNSIDPSHAVVYREAQAGNGRCDYAMRLFGTDNQPNHFGVIIEFKLIPNARADDSECCEQLAATALEQISKKYAMLLTGCLERMDIGKAAGYNTVYTKCRSFTRPKDDGNRTEVDNLFNKTPIEQSS